MSITVEQALKRVEAFASEMKKEGYAVATFGSDLKGSLFSHAGFMPPCVFLGMVKFAEMTEANKLMQSAWVEKMKVSS